MKLPSADRALVEHEKIVDYLLNPAHPDNGGKAEFFNNLGFRADEWKTLAESLRALALESDTAQSRKSPHGRKYVIVGRIKSPSGKMAWVQTVWIVDSGAEMARLVTAYPHKK